MNDKINKITNEKVCEISIVVANIIIDLCLVSYMLFREPITYNETNNYVEYIDRSEYNENKIIKDIEELHTVIPDQSLLGHTSIDVFDTDSCKDFEHYDYFTYSLDLTEQDKYLLAKLNECEAGNQNIRTRELVVLVVLNRVNISDSFPDTIEEVIKEEHNGVYQFSPLRKGGSWYYTEPSEDAIIAVDNVVNSLYDYSNGALYFESCQDEDNWHSRNLEFLYQSQNMRFYR